MLNSLRSLIFGGSSQINGKSAKIGSNKRFKKISEKGKTLPAIGSLMAGGVAAAVVEATLSFLMRCLGAIYYKVELEKKKN